MTPLQPLTPKQLCTTCDPKQFRFKSTKELDDLDGFIGQERAIEAIAFGVSINRQGYNIFALGPSGTGKHTLVNRVVSERAASEPIPSDWCYVNNFDEAHKPIALRMPTGLGRQLRTDMERLIDDLQSGLSSALDSEEYQTRRQVIEAEYRERQQEQLQTLQETAQAEELTLLRTPAGLAFAPVKDGNVVDAENFQKLPEEERKKIEAQIEELQKELQTILQQVPGWERELRTRIRELRAEVTGFVIEELMAEARKVYADLPDVLGHFDAVQADVQENLQDFLPSPDAGSDGEVATQASNMPRPAVRNSKRNPALRRYSVNLLVDSSNATGAPVIYEDNPSYLNLVGRVEQMAQMGALITDFTLIKPGALHRANGGYLLLDARETLSQPYVWEGLKRALKFGQIRIESPNQMLNLTSTVSLEPAQIPLHIKVILLGDRSLYYMLAQSDPDFGELFKVEADFNEVVERTPENQLLYARMIASIVRSRKLCPFNKAAVARVIDHSARLVADSERLTARVQPVVNLLEESTHWAAEAGAKTVAAKHVQQAIDAQARRADRARERMQEQVIRETILIDTAGAEVGQINGLAVLQLGNLTFGRPSRITANVRLGTGEVVDIERQVAMSGPSHSKGVLILSSYLGARFAAEHPLSLSASLVFEQSYSGVDGDSASSTELYALLSAISQVPIKQSLAVTGSVNQKGEVQAIGGANHKIEGFFDLCVARGLTGDQGVLIPAANVKHLMLRQDVVDAVKKGKFAVYAVETIEQGIELLTGVPAGAPNADGLYPDGSINRLVADRLADFARKRMSFNSGSKWGDA